ncbi:MAG: hypothetical protein C4526_09815 [Nitrospiraceae bacterium]|nr:MAG: hypothetical protein C4526_09815 [Nitrospiraceae bacterium]
MKMSDKDYYKSLYIQLREKLGKQPSITVFCKAFNIDKRKVDKCFGRNAFSKLAIECGDTPNIFMRPKTSLEDILINWGNLAKELKEIPVIADWDHRDYKPAADGIRSVHKLNWTDIPNKFLEHFDNKPEWNDVILLIRKNISGHVKQSNSVTQPSANFVHKIPLDCEKVITSINRWIPKRRRSSEEAYKVDLRNYFEEEFNFSVKEESGDSKSDLLVNKKIPIELKKSPSLSEYDRLFGQLVRHVLVHGTAIAVICDVERKDQYDDFKGNVKKVFDRLGLRVFVISK